jgi:hypothetical protein
MVPIKIRIREDLRRQIERLAKRDGISINQQIVTLLESGVLAEKAGFGGVGGVIRAAQAAATWDDKLAWTLASKAANEAFAIMLKEPGRWKEIATLTADVEKPTKPSEAE